MDFKQFSNLIMIEQTLFALPFALLGVVFAGGGDLFIWTLVMAAVAAARTAGMSFNRVIDARIDAKNPRTKDRLLPKGELSEETVWITAILSSLLLILTAWMLNDLCFYLSFPAVGLLFTYSYFKRFSASSHLYLGLVESAAPIGGYLAVTGAFSLMPFILGAIILFWIAGLDIVYALQDETFDAREGLKSIPVRYGRERAVMISTAFYGLSLVLLCLAGVMADKGPFFWTGTMLVAGIFTYQQRLARHEPITEVIQPFFRVNMVVSPILFFSAFFDLVFG